jgi:hypothetical protein
MITHATATIPVIMVAPVVNPTTTGIIPILRKRINFNQKETLQWSLRANYSITDFFSFFFYYLKDNCRIHCGRENGRGRKELIRIFTINLFIQ